MSNELETRLKAAADAAMSGVRLEHPGAIDHGDETTAQQSVSTMVPGRRNRRTVSAVLAAAAVVAVVGVVAAVSTGNAKPNVDVAAQGDSTADVQGSAPLDAARAAYDVLWSTPWKATITVVIGGESPAVDTIDPIENFIVVQPPDRTSMGLVGEIGGANDQVTIGNEVYMPAPGGPGERRWTVSADEVVVLEHFRHAAAQLLAAGEQCWSWEAERTVFGSLSCGEANDALSNRTEWYSPSWVRITLGLDGKAVTIESDDASTQDDETVRFDISYDDVPAVNIPDLNEVWPDPADGSHTGSTTQVGKRLTLPAEVPAVSDASVLVVLARWSGHSVAAAEALIAAHVRGELPSEVTVVYGATPDESNYELLAPETFAALDAFSTVVHDDGAIVKGLGVAGYPTMWLLTDSDLVLAHTGGASVETMGAFLDEVRAQLP